MAELMFVLLISAGVLLTSAQASYNKLPETYKKGVDLALKHIHAHEGVLQHFLFFSSIQQSKIEAGFDVTYIYHHFYLKATKCVRGTKNADKAMCAFRNDRPLIDCAVCYKTYAGEIETEPIPYVNCVHKPVLTEAMKTGREEHCNKMGYGSGSPTLLASERPE